MHRMRNPGSPEELEHRRFLAIRRLLEGYSTEVVAEFLVVDTRSVRRWFSCFRQSDDEGPRAASVAGRPPELSTTQEKIVLRWLREKPTEHGFDTELWTGRRLAHLIQEEFRHPPPSAVALRLAAGAGLHPPEAPACPPPTRPGGDRRMAPERMAARQKKARRQGASLALIDESGLLMAPLVRRTWSPRGQTPEWA